MKRITKEDKEIIFIKGFLEILKIDLVWMLMLIKVLVKCGNFEKYDQIIYTWLVRNLWFYINSVGFMLKERSKDLEKKRVEGFLLIFYLLLAKGNKILRQK